ncbi:MAG TPA: response regulator [Anaerolineae bacterium]|nr:response regulator [Anaerolineae bacterium]
MMKVLYVEDEPAQRELVNQLLSLAGFEVHLANNGLDGVAQAERWRPNVILMDLRMPGLNGFEAIERIRGIPSIAATPVIVLSAWTGTRLDQRATDLGVLRCVTKPFELEDLLEAIEAVSHSASDS